MEEKPENIPFVDYAPFFAVVMLTSALITMKNLPMVSVLLITVGMALNTWHGFKGTKHAMLGEMKVSFLSAGIKFLILVGILVNSL